MLPWESWDMDFDERLPIYQQIITRFCRSFVKGDVQPGDRIPSIRDMALALKVNANTIQRTYQEMERSGLISSKRGTGYFFTEDGSMIDAVKSRMAQESVGRFLEEMRAIGFTDMQILDEIQRNMEGGIQNGAAVAN